VNRKSFRLALLSSAVLSALAATGCMHGFINVPAYQWQPAAAGRAIVGVARVDITPPPGYPMGGHSLAGRFSRGRWGRLYARAFYFRDDEGHSVVLVSADLFAIPSGLQEAVAAAVNLGELSPSCPGPPKALCEGKLCRHTDIARGNLLLAATHTHQSPGNFMSSSFYNAFASQYPGFACEQFDSLAHGIAKAVRLAIDDAEIHASEAASLQWLRTKPIGGIVRNRAVPALFHDDPADLNKLLTLGPPSADCQSEGHSEVCLRDGAVDSRVTILLVERGSGTTKKSIGSLVFFATHPTALSDHVTVNSPDLAGVAMSVLERTEGANGNAGFVAGFFNGAEGDVSPRWGRQDAEDVVVLGTKLAEAVKEAVPIFPEEAPRVEAKRAAVRRSSFCEGARPIFGVATLGGAEDGRSFAFDLGWRSPNRSAHEPPRRSILSRFWRHLFYVGSRKGQDPKQPALDVKGLPGFGLTDIVVPSGGFPKEVPASLFRIGRMRLAAVPFEMTSLAGLVLKEKLGNPGETLVIGLANEYISYLTTPNEYLEQDYEGASTLYGGDSLSCLGDLMKLVDAAKPEREVQSRTFDAGSTTFIGGRPGPGFWGWNGIHRDASLQAPFLSKSPLERPLVAFEWKDDDPDEGVVLLTRNSSSWATETEDEFHLLVELIDGCVWSRGERRLSRQGPASCETKRWSATWLQNEPTDTPVRHQFLVRLTENRKRCSEEFMSNATVSGAGLGEAPCPPDIP
jgi:neutral ceramidase